MEWSIQARSHQCQACGRGFREKETLHTLLFDERNAYRRLDVCAGCWTGQYAEGANHRRGFVSHWHGAYRPPPLLPPEAIQRDTAESLLRKLIERNDPHHAAACFILAVMLERKRLLKVKDQTTEGGRRVFIYEHPKSGDVFTIPDPALQLDQLEAVQRDVAHLLEQGLDPVVVPSAPATGASVGEGAAMDPIDGSVESAGAVGAAGEPKPTGEPAPAADATGTEPPPTPPTVAGAPAV